MNDNYALAVGHVVVFEADMGRVQVGGIGQIVGHTDDVFTVGAHYIYARVDGHFERQSRQSLEKLHGWGWIGELTNFVASVRVFQAEISAVVGFVGDRGVSLFDLKGLEPGATGEVSSAEWVRKQRDENWGDK